jgi:hypothetical protein
MLHQVELGFATASPATTGHVATRLTRRRCQIPLSPDAAAMLRSWNNHPPSQRADT